MGRDIGKSLGETFGDAWAMLDNMPYKREGVKPKLDLAYLS